jgi:FMN reductase [NAD(P)H]
MTYWQQLGRSDGLTWSQNLGNNLKQVYFPQVRPVAAMQGLLNDK